MMQSVLDSRHWEGGVDQLLGGVNPWLKQNWQTELVAGRGEPVYSPAAVSGQLHRIYFAHGYFNSALHELAHWCVAGERRRRLEDYGYWYCPDGRTAAQQAEFEQVEVKPQALEWWFSQACGRKFRTSLDNLAGEDTDSLPFRDNVRQQALMFAAQGLPVRAEALVTLLCATFGVRRPCRRDFAAAPP